MKINTFSCWTFHLVLVFSCAIRMTLRLFPFLQALKPVVILESRMTGLTKHTLASDWNWPPASWARKGPRIWRCYLQHLWPHLGASVTCQGRMSWSRFAKPEQREACFEGDHLIKLASCFLPSSSSVKLKTLLSTQVRQGSLNPFISSSVQHATLIKTPFPTSHHESPSAGVSGWVAEWRHFPQNSSNTYSVVFYLFDCFLRLQLKITHLNDCFFFFFNLPTFWPEVNASLGSLKLEPLPGWPDSP